MIKVMWDSQLKDDYTSLFSNCVVDPSAVNLAKSIVHKIASNKDVYQKIANGVGSGIPWYFIGCIHSLECNLDFHKHLHNGDPLTARTVHVPSGRPIVGYPPFTFEGSALDALVNCQHLDKWRDWSMAAILYKLEGYNGYGYRQYHPTVKSPYLWSMTNQYKKGKYVADGHFDPNVKSQQLGIAAVLKTGQQLKVF